MNLLEVSLSRGLTFDGPVSMGPLPPPLTPPTAETAIKTHPGNRYPLLAWQQDVLTISVDGWHTRAPAIGDAWDFDAMPFYLVPSEDGCMFVPGTGQVLA